MANDDPATAPGARWSVARIYFPAGMYSHPPAGLVQVRVVRRGSSYADVDLGAGSRRVFTRPGDVLVSLPDRPTAFRISDGRELTLLQIEPTLANSLLASCDGGALDDLRPLTRRPIREPVAAELIRRLEAGELGSATSREWSVGVVLTCLRAASAHLAMARRSAVLSYSSLRALQNEIMRDIAAPWPVAQLAEKAGLPRRVFAAAFKEATGLPVHQYLLRLRAERAAVLLRETDLPIAGIAVQTGFASQSHLTRSTARLFHRSPKQIRSNSDRTSEQSR